MSDPTPTPPPSPETASALEPEAAGGEAAPSTEEVMQKAAERIAALEKEGQELKEKWLRAEAELANVRARAKREVEEARLYALQKFAADLVETAENIRRGLASLPAPEPGEPEIITRMREGFAGIERNFLATLEKHGIRGEEALGAPFDPHLHEAMAEQETAEHPPGTVVQAWSRAWLLNGRLIKPAMVVVAKAPASSSSTPSAKE
jgi:molecular chaperone GrpE